jgi:hypothetical protein
MIPKEKPQIETPDFSEPAHYEISLKHRSKILNLSQDFLDFIKNKYAASLMILTILSIISIWILWFAKMVEFGQIYSPLLTNKFLGNISNYSLPIFGTIIFIINIILAEKAFNREKLASYFLLGSAFFIQILILILIRSYLSLGL